MIQFECRERSTFRCKNKKQKLLLESAVHVMQVMQLSCFWFFFFNSDWFDVLFEIRSSSQRERVETFPLFSCYLRQTRLGELTAYLDVLGKLIIGEDTERCEVADRVELEDDLDGLAVARVVTPPDPT